MSNQNPAPGWYPAAHANNEQRYWDGTQWIEPHFAVERDARTAVYTPATTVDPAATISNGAAPTEPTKKSAKKGWIIAGSVVAGLVIVGGIGNALGLGNRGNDTAAAPKPTVAAVEPAEVEEPEPVIVAVPTVVGLTVTDAVAQLLAAGLVAPALSSFEDPAALVVSTDPAAGVEVNEGDAIAVVAAEKPKLTLAQQNAVGSAKGYLDYAGFSRSGLISQLEYEGFSTEEATFGADNAGADWNEEAAESAQTYLDYSAFSRQGLYDQLAYEGFQASEIDYGLAAVGY